jgi:membrane-associated protease RseP (regulator of RpoE activity)
VHPVAYAGVIGLYITALNLVPIGQLDGGHVAFAVFGPRAEKVGRIAGWVLLGMAVFCSASWLLWWLLVTRLVRFGHPPVLHPEQPISPGRKLVVAASVLLLILTLTPVSMDVL